MANLKAHAIAGGIMLMLGYVGLTFFHSNKPQPVSGDIGYINPYFIQIYSATYGMNCHGSEEFLPADEHGMREPVIVSIKRNNRLGRVSEHCNEETRCPIKVSTKTLGDAETYGCDPSLEIKYRCFRVDKLQKVTIADGDKDVLDCSEETVKARLGEASNAH